jgi:hypothetical protein
MIDTLERLYIYKETKSNNQIKDKLTVKTNAIFETIVQEDPYRGHSGSLYPDGQNITQSWEDIHPRWK